MLRIYVCGWVCATILIGTGRVLLAEDRGGTLRGIVFEDANGNGRRDAGERGLAGVGVSNGRDIVDTTSDGRYALAMDDDDIAFVIKPRGYMVPLDALNIPRFYYVHKPAGSPPDLAFAGVSPTGPLPTQHDFALRPQQEPDTFDIVLLGDPQPRDIKEVHYFAQDVVPGLLGTKAAFMAVLGDIAYDDLSVFQPLNEIMGLIGTPIVAIHGNHDINIDSADDQLSDETWERVYGPSTWSFNWGPAHFIVLDNVHYTGPTKRDYRGELGRYLTFVENDLRRVPTDALVILMMHIPLVDVVDRAQLFALLADRPHTFSISAHWHLQRQYFMGPDDGWHGAQPHHHLVQATASGAWWEGALDERGIPHATMRDGAPNGYSVLTIDGHDYRVRFVPSRRPPGEQLAIHVPNRVPKAQLAITEVLVNVYAGSPRSTVDMRVVGHTDWQALQQAHRVDPDIAAIKFREASKTPPDGRPMPAPIENPHLWRGTLPVDLALGAHIIEARTRDMFGQVDHARRIVRVVVAPY